MPTQTIEDHLKQVDDEAAPTVKVHSYSWKEGSQYKVDPAKTVTALREIYKTHRGVTPELVIAAAQDKDHILHDEIEWDDTEASRLYRLDLGRHVLRSLICVYERPDQTLTPPIRVFVKLVPSVDDPTLDDIDDDAVQPHVYLPIREIMTEPRLRERARRQAFRELSTWRQRYRDISEFAAVFDQIDRLAAEWKDVG